MMKVLCKMLPIEFYNANFLHTTFIYWRKLNIYVRQFQQDPVSYRPNSALFLVSINSSFKLQTFDQIDLI
jgi:hypothetical protein